MFWFWRKHKYIYKLRDKLLAMKSKEQVKDKIIETSKINKEGAAGSKNRGWLEALHWVIE